MRIERELIRDISFGRIGGMDGRNFGRERGNYTDTVVSVKFKGSRERRVSRVQGKKNAIDDLRDAYKG